MSLDIRACTIIRKTNWTRSWWVFCEHEVCAKCIEPWTQNSFVSNQKFHYM